jgi:hypothetical protein
MTLRQAGREIDARVLTLPERAPAADEMPIMGPHGRLTFRNHSVYVSERSALLLSALTEC